MEVNEYRKTENIKTVNRKANKISEDLSRFKNIPKKERSASQVKPMVLSPLNKIKLMPLSDRPDNKPKLKRNTLFSNLEEINSLHSYFKTIEYQEEIALSYILKEFEFNNFDLIE